jgi:hypothetical protein
MTTHDQACASRERQLRSAWQQGPCSEFSILRMRYFCQSELAGCLTDLFVRHLPRMSIFILPRFCRVTLFLLSITPFSLGLSNVIVAHYSRGARRRCEVNRGLLLIWHGGSRPASGKGLCFFKFACLSNSVLGLVSASIVKTSFWCLSACFCGLPCLTTITASFFLDRFFFVLTE